MNVELGVDLAHVRLDRVRGQMQFIADLASSEVGGKIPKHTQFSVAKAHARFHCVARRGRRCAGEHIQNRGQERPLRVVRFQALEELAGSCHRKRQDSRSGFR